MANPVQAGPAPASPTEHGGTLRRAMLVLLGAGMALLLCSAAGVWPMQGLAARMSADGEVSASLASLLRASQWTLAWIVLASPAVLYAACRYRGWLTMATAGSDRAFAGAAAAASFLLAWWCQETVFSGIPHVSDAVAHFFQAQILGAGEVTAPLPVCYELFRQPHIVMTTTGEWYSKYPPGQAIINLLATRCGLMPLLMPLLSALGTAAFHLLVRRWETPGLARTATALFALSPLGVLLAGSFMSHTSFLSLLLAGLLGLAVALRDDRGHAGAAVLGGFCLGYCVLLRPQDLVFAGAGVALAVLVHIRALGLRLLRAVPWLLAGAAAPLAIHAWWNYRLYGNVVTVGYGFTEVNFLYPTFQAAYGLSADFGWRDAMELTIQTTLRFNKALFGWPASLLLLPLAWADRRARGRGLLAVGGLLFALAYFFYDYHGQEFEARYYHPLAPVCAVLTAMSVRALRDMWQASAGPRLAAAGAATLLICCTAHAALFYWPRQLLPEYGNRYEDVDPTVHRLTEQTVVRPALVFLPPIGRQGTGYSSGFLYNDPWLTNEIIYAYFNEQKCGCAATGFPTRAAYLYTQTEGAGRLDPISPAEWRPRP